MPTQYFLNYRVSKKNVLCPPNIESLMCHPPPSNLKVTTVLNLYRLNLILAGIFKASEISPIVITSHNTRVRNLICVAAIKKAFSFSRSEAIIGLSSPSAIFIHIQAVLSFDPPANSTRYKQRLQRRYDHVIRYNRPVVQALFLPIEKFCIEFECYKYTCYMAGLLCFLVFAIFVCS